MKLPFKVKSNPQAFRASLYITFTAFALDFIFKLFYNTNPVNEVTYLLTFIYFFILFLIIRLTLEIFIRTYIKNEEERRSEINILKDQENYRREFLGNISHELKTPLFTIQGYILTLVEGGALKDKKVREKYLRRAAKGVDRIISIVKDLDLITQFESGIKTVDRSEFNIYDLIENVFDLLEFESEKNSISLKLENNNSLIYVNADQERILQVLTNLIVNSIKYGSDNGHTKVIVEDYNKEKVIVRVIDNGEGIEQEHLPRLFERFYRIDKNRSRKKGGSGLGLSIVKHIIEAHQEEIFVKSKIGKGTEFSFTLQKPKTSSTKIEI